MAKPQPTEAHLRIAHRILAEIMASDFTKRQRKILDLILRLSSGCGKKEAFIPRKKDFEVVGVGEGHIKGELRWLQLAKVITISANQYSFNENYDEWRVSRAKGYDPEKLTELVRINLTHKSKTYQNGKTNLPKEEDSASQSGKNSTSKLASAKENIKEKLYKEKGELLSPSHKELFNILKRCPAIKEGDIYKLPELLQDYPDVKHALEFKKFVEWWPGPKKRKKPWAVLRNWLERAQGEAIQSPGGERYDTATENRQRPKFDVEIIKSGENESES